MKKRIIKRFEEEIKMSAKIIEEESRRMERYRNNIELIERVNDHVQSQVEKKSWRLRQNEYIR